MRTRGFTLIETLVVLVVVSIVLAYGFPKVRTFMVKNSLRGARGALLTAIQQAKTWAVTDGRATTVHLDGTGLLWITASPTRRSPPGASTEDTVSSAKNLTTVYGAATTPATALTFDQRGLLSPMGASTQVIAMVKSGYRDSVMINGYGRITK